jgi:hypothetical protein
MPPISRLPVNYSRGKEEDNHENIPASVQMDGKDQIIA